MGWRVSREPNAIGATKVGHDLTPREHLMRPARRKLSDAYVIRDILGSDRTAFPPCSGCPIMLSQSRSRCAPNAAGLAGHIPAHRTWRAYYRERRTPLISEVPVDERAANERCPQPRSGRVLTLRD
jgi:hypothetical protein